MSRQGSAAVGETIEQLRGAYGGFPVVEERTTVPHEALVQCMTSASEGRLGGARALLERGGRTLLVRYRENPDVWDLPGGSLDRHENHEQTAKRHVAEQVGVECVLTGAFRARRQTFTLVDGGEGASGLWIHFEAEPLGTEADLDPSDEIVEARWFDDPPEALAAPIRERLADDE
ncbi:8-oxo-dGTP pyrophosphatase MutT (NUDIX family) [Halarchaeum rubridurum]|uniref:8-oxo-dGTP pyrophosphatase MutT (NUDIX family) n=1 Tax=Halarchaeum rubridurum TaxID=489911 RepID=A0A830G1X2_9EURY|nr:NUDIX domain-containing protein [Halarchaeum rubridurum]MBP1955340.1 8-oxo-dGTP pyrophosphatase MutT (NUDIX family) [Halarchaeum rubridurum]GGM71627.1 NUDIX hydrolase [Halarchaeum rubridurum]